VVCNSFVSKYFHRKSCHATCCFGFIMVDDSQFAPGMYYYNLSVNGVVSSSQKMVVIK